MKTKLLNRSILGGVLFVCAGALAACDGDDALADEAKEKADAMCACKDFDCTTEHMAWFNKQSVTNEDGIKAMSEEGQKSYTEHRKRGGECQKKLRG